MRTGNKTFETRDFYIAAFLKAKDIKLIRAVREGRLSTFYFVRISGIDELIVNFYNYSEMVCANEFKNAIRDLKSLTYNIK